MLYCHKGVPKDLDIRSKSAEYTIFNMIRGFEVDFDALIPVPDLSQWTSVRCHTPFWASNPEHIQMVQDKFTLSHRLAELGYPHPHVYENINCKPDRFPVIIKPRKGGGGIFNRIARSEQELAAAVKELWKLNPLSPY
jgi:carbamoylphosphate synthase large subunit